MPDASAWQEVCRWEFSAENEDDGDDLDDEEVESQFSEVIQQDRDDKVITLRSTAGQ